MTEQKPNFDLVRNLQNGEHIADVITPEMIQGWKRGHKILITANTGAGKTYFIMNTLYHMCKNNKRRMLFLTNRIWLKEQLISLYGEQVEDVITLMNYQSLINYIKFQRNKIEGIYDLIVSDEAHYFFNDSIFADETDVPLNYLINETDKELVVFLSATSQTLEDYFNQKTEHKLNFKYKITKPYVFKDYYYWNSFDVIKKFLTELPKDEKAIYFSKNINRALEFHHDFPNNSSFICAQGNKRFGDKCDMDTLKQLKENEKFNKQILFTTNVIENGININDPQLKHIIIDIYDFDTIIQCIGRRRIRDGEELPNIYIRQVKQSAVSTVINNTNFKLKPLEYFRSHNNEEFNKKYGSKNLHGLLYTESIESNQNISKYVVNAAKEFKYKHDLKIAEEINDTDTKLGHLILFCRYMQIDFLNFKDLSSYYTEISLEDKFNYYLDRPLFGDEKTNFVELLKKEVLKPLKGGYKVITVNDYFKDIQLPYYIISEKENRRTDEHYGKRYWLLKFKVA